MDHLRPIRAKVDKSEGAKLAESWAFPRAREWMRWNEERRRKKRVRTQRKGRGLGWYLYLFVGLENSVLVWCNEGPTVMAEPS